MYRIAQKSQQSWFAFGLVMLVAFLFGACNTTNVPIERTVATENSYQSLTDHLLVADVDSNAEEDDFDHHHAACSTHFHFHLDTAGYSQVVHPCVRSQARLTIIPPARAPPAYLA